MRPFPPELLIDEYEGIDYFVPSPELDLWVRKSFLDDQSELFNQDHLHLNKAHIGYLWTNVPNTKQMMRVAATAEIPFFRGNAWQKHRQMMQMEEWFGGTPDFVITFDAGLAHTASALEVGARTDHELDHCAQALDKFGSPKFDAETGQPKFTLKGHDVEEHVGVIARYGVGGGAGKTRELVEAANRAPVIGLAEIEGICGTC